MARLAARRWAAIIERYETSGQSVAEFAQANGMNPRTLAWWRWRLRKDGLSQNTAAPTFVELVVDSGHQASTPLIVQLEHTGARIQVNSHTDLRLLRHVVDALC